MGDSLNKKILPLNPSLEKADFIEIPLLSPFKKGGPALLPPFSKGGLRGISLIIRNKIKNSLYYVFAILQHIQIIEPHHMQPATKASILHQSSSFAASGQAVSNFY
jgi:hypothetical protein